MSLTDTELIAMVRCAGRRVIVIAPGLSVPVAQALIETWNELGPDAVSIVLDPDPEVCRLGFGDVEALKLLHEKAEQLGTCIHQQQGLRLGVIITDEATAVYSPTPLLVEAGGAPGERQNGIRFETPLIEGSAGASPSDLGDLNLHTNPISKTDLQKTQRDLETNPPVKFDLAQKVRVFNARFEFVEFELRGLSISRKTVRIPPDLLGLAKDPKAQKLLRSSFQLIEADSDLSGDRVNRLKQFIAKKYLIPLAGYGTVILRTNKSDFEVAVKALNKYVLRFQRTLKKKLQAAMDGNRDVLVEALLPGVVANPPDRWQRFLSKVPDKKELERLLRTELTKSFGSVDHLCDEMNVKAVFKGVTYESLSDPEFRRLANAAIPSLDILHDEFEAAKAHGQLEFG
jgi:hypothetical protein